MVWVLYSFFAFTVCGSPVEVAGYAESNRFEKSDAGLVIRPRDMDALCSPIQLTVTLSIMEPQQTVVELSLSVSRGRCVKLCPLQKPKNAKMRRGR